MTDHIINIYCVLVKPLYDLSHVENLYSLCKKYLSYDFKFNCLTDSQYSSELPINFIDINEYELDTWWNKVIIFDKNISGKGKNLYFDLDTNITDNIDFLLNDIKSGYLTVVDTPWKPESFRSKRDGLHCYGNSSVMGWLGDEQSYLLEKLLIEVFVHTIKHKGDDTYLNYNAKIKYFQRYIICALKEREYVDKKIIYIHYNSLTKHY